MVQELQVLRCYSCNTFQGQIVKKVQKWQCKICNEKQSVQKVYYQGSGQDCRVQVQHLNYMKHMKDEKEFDTLKRVEITEEDDDDDDDEDRKPPIAHSKWTKYLVESQKELRDDTGANENKEVEHLSSFYATNVTPRDENEEENGNEEAERWLPHVQTDINNDSSGFDRSRNDILIPKKKTLESDDRYQRTAENSIGSNLFSNSYVNDDNDDENDGNSLVTRNGGKRKFEDENDAETRYKFDNDESRLNSPSLSLKRAKFADGISLRKQNLCDIIKSNRSEIKRCLENRAERGFDLRNRESVISETNESLLANELTVLKPDTKKIKVFQSDSDDLDDNFDI